MDEKNMSDHVEWVVEQLKMMAEELDGTEAGFEEYGLRVKRIQDLMHQAADGLLKEYGIVEFTAVSTEAPEIKCLN